MLTLSAALSIVVDTVWPRRDAGYRQFSRLQVRGKRVEGGKSVLQIRPLYSPRRARQFGVDIVLWGVGVDPVVDLLGRCDVSKSPIIAV